jgi:HEAT repeat protein
MDDHFNDFNNFDDFENLEVGELPEPPPPPDVEEVLQLLHSSAALDRTAAARAFCELQDSRAIPRLLELLTDDCPLVRVGVCYALGRNFCDAAIAPLIATLEQDWNGYVRKGIVWTLGNCRDPRALAPLISSLRYDISAVRLWAASALGHLGSCAAIAPLIDALETDPVAAVRSNCAWALGKLLPQHPLDRHSPLYRRAVNALSHGLEDEDLGVQNDVRDTIRRWGDRHMAHVLEQMEWNQGYCEL